MEKIKGHTLSNAYREKWLNHTCNHRIINWNLFEKYTLYRMKNRIQNICDKIVSMFMFYHISVNPMVISSSISYIWTRKNYFLTLNLKVFVFKAISIKKIGIFSAMLRGFGAQLTSPLVCCESFFPWFNMIFDRILCSNNICNYMVLEAQIVFKSSEIDRLINLSRH